MNELLVQHGEVIGYVLAGVLALIGLGLIQIFRRRSDLKKAKIAVRLVTYSLAAPRVGPVAISGTYRDANGEQWIEVNGERVGLHGAVDIVRGTRARWKSGERTYSLRDRDSVYAIGVMQKSVDGWPWRLSPSAGEGGVQLYAVAPRPAPAPLLSWRGPLIFAVCGAISYGGLVGVGNVLADAGKGSCDELVLSIASAMPQARETALANLARCKAR
ncbi:MAG TPA: hypothetical protein VIV11_26090 [Kofleriaceae bacterium]